MGKLQIYDVIKCGLNQENKQRIKTKKFSHFVKISYFQRLCPHIKNWFSSNTNSCIFAFKKKMMFKIKGRSQINVFLKDVVISDHFPFRSRREVPAGTGTGIPASRSAAILAKAGFPFPVPATKNSRKNKAKNSRFGG